MTDRPALAAYLPGVVVLDVHTAARLALLLELGVRARPPGTDVDPDMRRALAAFSAARRAVAGATAGPTDALPPLGPATTAARSSGQGALSVGDVARRAGISPRGVRFAARSGRLVGQRLTDRWEFTEDAVTAWIEWRQATRGCADDDKAA